MPPKPPPVEPPKRPPPPLVVWPEPKAPVAVEPKPGRTEGVALVDSAGASSVRRDEARLEMGKGKGEGKGVGDIEDTHLSRMPAWTRSRRSRLTAVVAGPAGRSQRSRLCRRTWSSPARGRCGRPGSDRRDEARGSGQRGQVSTRPTRQDEALTTVEYREMNTARDLRDETRNEKRRWMRGRASRGGEVESSAVIIFAGWATGLGLQRSVDGSAAHGNRNARRRPREKSRTRQK